MTPFDLERAIQLSLNEVGIQADILMQGPVELICGSGSTVSCKVFANHLSHVTHYLGGPGQEHVTFMLHRGRVHSADETRVLRSVLIGHCTCFNNYGMMTRFNTEPTSEAVKAAYTRYLRTERELDTTLANYQAALERITAVTVVAHEAPKHI